MSRDELAVMDGNKCILQLRGVRSFLSDKFDITRHKRYKELSDYDKKNAFDVEAYMKHQLKIRMKEEFDLYEEAGSSRGSGVRGRSFYYMSGQDFVTRCRKVGFMQDRFLKAYRRKVYDTMSQSRIYAE